MIGVFGLAQGRLVPLARMERGAGFKKGSSQASERGFRRSVSVAVFDLCTRGSDSYTARGVSSAAAWARAGGSAPGESGFRKPGGTAPDRDRPATRRATPAAS